MAKICRNCNSRLMDTAAFCNHCGARVSGEEFDSEKMKKCEHCGAVLNKNARFCTNCGLPVDVPEAKEYAMRCERCGTWLKQGMRFCNNCGRRVNIMSYDFTNTPTEIVNKPKIIPALKPRDRRMNDYDSTLELKEDFGLPPIDEIVIPAAEEVIEAPEPELIEAEIVSVPGEDVPVSLEKPAETASNDEDVIYSDAPVELVPEIPEEAPVSLRKEPEDESDAVTGELL